MMATHKLKTWPVFFQAILEGRKKHEIRVNDRDYRAGDSLVLQEYEPEVGRYTGREIIVQVTYLTPGGTWGLPANVCVMSIHPLHSWYFRKGG